MIIQFLFYLFTLFPSHPPGGSSSATLLNSVRKSAYIATAVNPSLLCHLDKNGIGIVYSQPYNISQIQYSRLSANYKNFGFGFSRLGQTGYAEYIFSLSAGMSFNQNLSYGLILKGLYLDLGNYGQSFTPALNIGFSYQLNKISFGSVIENLNSPNNSTGENIPWQILAGAMFEPVSDFLLGLEITKSASDQNLALGAELKPIPILAVRLGTKTNPFIISGGLGIEIKNISIDYAIKFHPQLKQTSVISIGYFW